MDSWRDLASQQAQADFEALVDYELGFAEHQLTKRGEFHPFSAWLPRSGDDVRSVAHYDGNEFPDSNELIGRLRELARSERDTLRAVAVTANVTLRDDDDAIRISFEHAEGLALELVCPYRRHRLRRRIEIGQIRVSPDERRIWPAGTIG
jgi:hypothetical protein